MASLSLVFDLIGRDNASGAFRRVGDEAETAGRKVQRVTDDFVEFDKATARVANAVNGLAKVAKFSFGALGTQAAVGGLTALAAAIAPASGALLALPAAGAAAGAALGALKIGTIGMGDAFKAVAEGDAEALSEAMQKLAPSARGAVSAVQSVKPAFDGLRLDVQQALFVGVGAAIQDTAGRHLPGLRAGLVGVAEELRQTGLQAVAMVNSARTVDDVRVVFDNTRAALDRLNPVGQSVISIFRDLAAVGSGFLPSLAGGFAGAAQRAAEFVAAARETGRLREWIQGGLDAAQQLGQVFINVGSIIAGVFRAGQEVGGGFLGTLREVTGRVAEFVNSFQGQTALSSFFDSVARAIQVVLPLALQLGAIFLGTLGPALAQIAIGLAPLVQSLLPLLQRTLAVVLPILISVAEWLGRNAEVVIPLAAGLGALVGGVNLIIGAMRTWTSVQLVLNAALAANPIGLVITIVAALVAGLITAYQTSDTFRAIVDRAFRVIAEAGRWMWENVLRPAFTQLKAGWDVLATGISIAWERWIQPAWAAVMAAATFMWNNVLRPYFAQIGENWTILSRGIMAAWETIIRPAWNNLQAAARFLWENVLRPVFSQIGAGWDLLGRGLRAVFDGVIRPMFDNLVRVATTARDFVVDRFNRLRDSTVAIFTAIRDTVGRVWDGLLEKVRTPIRVAFTFVNDNMIGPVNRILDNFPGNLAIPRLPRLAGGGRITGPGTGTSDSILGVNARGVPMALVSNGEFLINEEAYRRNRDLVHAINAGTLPQYARGGEIGGPFDFLGDAWTATKSAVSAVGNFATDLIAKGARKAAELILNPIRGAAARLIPDKVPLVMLEGGINRLVDAVLGKADVKDRQLAAAAAAAASASGGSPAGPAGSGGLGGTWHSIWNAVKAAIPQARINSTFRPGDPGYHGRNKAIDFGYGTGPGGAGSAGLASINRFLHDRYGRNLAELIYDGIGDDRPDLKNGRPLTYNAGTRAAHRNHVHAAVYDSGGWLRPGYTLAYNGTGRDERIRTADQEAALQRSPLVERVEINVRDNQTAYAAMDELEHRLRVASLGGRYAWAAT